MNVADPVMDRSAETLIPQFYPCISEKSLITIQIFGRICFYYWIFFSFADMSEALRPLLTGLPQP